MREQLLIIMGCKFVSVHFWLVWESNVGWYLYLVIFEFENVTFQEFV